MCMFSDEDVAGNEPIEADKPHDQIRQDPYTLPSGFRWELVDIHNEIEVFKIYMVNECQSENVILEKSQPEVSY